jgi:hypothetical protein
VGVVEKGWYDNDIAYNTQPWLPDGPIPHTVTWTMPGYVAPGGPPPGGAAEPAQPPAQEPAPDPARVSISTA